MHKNFFVIKDNCHYIWPHQFRVSKQIQTITTPKKDTTSCRPNYTKNLAYWPWFSLLVIFENSDIEGTNAYWFVRPKTTPYVMNNANIHGGWLPKNKELWWNPLGKWITPLSPREWFQHYLKNNYLFTMLMVIVRFFHDPKRASNKKLLNFADQKRTLRRSKSK